MISQPLFEKRELSVCIVAGEASGDAQGALLVRALRGELDSAGIKLDIWGSGGKLMRAAGVETLVHIDELSAMGFVEVLTVYPRISAAAHRLQNAMQLRRPDITILIDYPGLNLRLMEDAFHLGSCVVYHIPPKVWAHGARRAARLRDCSYLVTCILPFEESLLRRAGVNARFVGNPLNDEISDFLKSSAHSKHVSANSTVVGIVPGSRSGEIEKVFPTLVQAFVKTKRTFAKELKAVVPVANTVSRNHLEYVLHSTLVQESAEKMRVDIELVSDSSLKSVLSECSYAWVCSGTAALEAALLGVPMSVAYKMHWMSYTIAKRLVSLPHVSLVNLCAGREIVPEYIQDAATPEALSAHALSLLNSPEKSAAMRADLATLKSVFPKDSARNAARAILDCYGQLPLEPAKRFHYKSVRDLWNEEREWGLAQ
jgi:lipid-A-disaccharide synthase